MIETHENRTFPLTEKELEFIPIILKGLKTKLGIKNAVTTPEIISGTYLYELRYNSKAKKLQPVRVRALLRHIIVNNLLPGLISSGSGFYIATVQEEMNAAIQSLTDRITAIQAKRAAWIRQRNELFFSQNKLFK